MHRMTLQADKQSPKLQKYFNKNLALGPTLKLHLSHKKYSKSSPNSDIHGIIAGKIEQQRYCFYPNHLPCLILLIINLIKFS